MINPHPPCPPDRGTSIDTNTYDAPDHYSPYGEPAGTLPIIPTFYGYRGEHHTNTTIWLRNRVYNPDTGTFTTQDPLDGIAGTTTTTNPYHYTDNNPTNNTDPLGLRPDDTATYAPCTAALIIAAGDGPLPFLDTVGAALCVSTIVVVLFSPAACERTDTDCGSVFREIIERNFPEREASPEPGEAPRRNPPPVGPPLPDEGDCAPQTGGSDDCGLPVFMPGGDTPNTTAHIVDALASNPAWSVLTRAEHPDSTTRRDWYTGDPRCAGSVGDGLSCDEFPFYKTRQGGPGASLRQVPDSENLPQARGLSAFYRSCRIAQGSSFVVAPMLQNPTTTWTC